MKRSLLTKLGLVLGCLSVAFTVLFYLLTARMAKLPYGNNDFDLILLAIALLDILLWVCAFFSGIAGLICTGVEVFRAQDRRHSAIWASVNLASLLALFLYFAK